MLKYKPMGRRSWLFVAIIILASILRLYRLGETPIALEWDEVAIGYDAYSILKTGKDQFGQFLPLTFRSLDDYKPPIYEYLTVPSIAAFGLTEFATRLPSALAGITAVALTYFLARQIFSNTPNLKQHARKFSLLAALLLAVSPWHLQFSRAAFEVNVSVTITIAAVLAFLQGLKNPKFFLISASLFGMDLFSYHSTRVVTPLLLVTLVVLFNKELPKKKFIGAFWLIYFAFFIVFIPILTSPDAQIRFKATNIFTPGARYLDEKDLPKIFLEKRQQDQKAGFDLAGRIFHNNRLIYTDYETLKKAAGKYLSHYGFEFLFVNADAPLHHAPGFGLLHLWEAPLFIIGLLYLLTKGINKYTLILLSWFLIVPIPSAVTREAPHSVRTELFLPTFQIFTAAGIAAVYKLIKKESWWVFYSLSGLAALVFTVNHSFYLHQYYVHTNYELSQNWLYGRKEAAEYTESVKNRYDKVLISLRVDMPHMFWLFYTKYPPVQYLKEGGTVSGGFADERNKFGKYEFRNFNYDNLPGNEKILVVGTAKDIPPHANIKKTINYLDGSIGLLIAEN